MPGKSCKILLWVMYCFSLLSVQRELVTQAVTYDREQNITSALNYYTQAIEYFIPAIECTYISLHNKVCDVYLFTCKDEQDLSIKEGLRVKVSF